MPSSEYAVCLSTVFPVVYLSAFTCAFARIDTSPQTRPKTEAPVDCGCAAKSAFVVSPISPGCSSLQPRSSFTALTCAHRRRTRRRIINERWLLQPPVGNYFTPLPHSAFLAFFLYSRRKTNIFIHSTENFRKVWKRGLW